MGERSILLSGAGVGALIKRAVKICKTGHQAEAILEWPVMPPWRVMLYIPGDISYESVGYDLFECLLKLREYVAPKGWQICVVGARKDAWPSGMGSDMSGAALVYIHTLGRQASGNDLHPIFHDAPCESIGSVEEQRDFREQWLRSLQK